MKNITVAKYIKLKNKLPYNMLLGAVKAKDAFKFPFDQNKLSYNDVRRIESLLSKSRTIEEIKEIFTTAYQCDEIFFWQLPIVNYFQTKRFLYESFASLKQLEIKLLQSYDEDSELWKAAVGDSLNNYSSISLIDAYSKIYGGRPFENGKQRYNDILFYMAYNKSLNRANKEFNKLKYGNK
jgi:hypothetical protein